MNKPVNNGSRSSSVIPGKEEMQQMAEKMADMSEKMQRLMDQCDSGRHLLTASSAMAQSALMATLLQSIDALGNEKYAFTLGKYLGEFMQKDQEEGLVRFAKYVRGLGEDPRFSAHKEQYYVIASHSEALNESDVYRAFVEANSAFMEDESEETMALKEQMAELMASDSQSG